jgi:hypothetical protein
MKDAPEDPRSLKVTAIETLTLLLVGAAWVYAKDLKEVLGVLTMAVVIAAWNIWRVLKDILKVLQSADAK